MFRTFTSALTVVCCAVLYMAVFFVVPWFCTLLVCCSNVLNDSEMVPVAPVITGITFPFTFHMCWISIIRSLYFKIYYYYFWYYYYYYYYYYYFMTVLSNMFLGKKCKNKLIFKRMDCKWGTFYTCNLYFYYVKCLKYKLLCKIIKFHFKFQIFKH